MKRESSSKKRLVPIKAHSVDRTPKQKPLKFAEDVQRNRLKKMKSTFNRQKYIQIDQTLEKNIFNKADLKIFCAITGSKIKDQTNFSIFRNRTIVFQIRTKLLLEEDDKKKVYKVRRFESDFYILRSILSLSFGQCMIPCINPAKAEKTFDKKGISFREKFFSRFLRGILRSPELRNHPLVLEFFKTDHFKDGENAGMKLFSQSLEKAKLELTKNRGTCLNAFRISSINTRIPVQPEFTEVNLEGRKDGKIFDQSQFDEAFFVDKYEKVVGKMMGEIKKYSKQYGSLMKSYNKMKTALDKTGNLHARYEEDQEKEYDHTSQFHNE